RALWTNKFQITALATAETENATDHAKREKKSFICDLIIECRRLARRRAVTMHGQPRTPEQRELFHIGVAIAEADNAGYAQLRENFLKRVAKMQNRKINAPLCANNQS